MGDLLDEILAEMKEEKKTTAEKNKIKNDRKTAQRRSARLILAQKVEALLNKVPRKDNGTCVYCGSLTGHRDNCVFLELYIEYTRYKNKFLVNTGGHKR